MQLLSTVNAIDIAIVIATTIVYDIEIIADDPPLYITIAFALSVTVTVAITLNASITFIFCYQLILCFCVDLIEEQRK